MAANASLGRERSVLITGCSAGGIGHALALELHARGFRVIATARHLSSMTDLRSREPPLELFELDVTRPSSVASLYRTLTTHPSNPLQHLDVLINNAGRSYLMPAADYDMSEVAATFDTNVFGAMRMVQAFLPLLLGDGLVVNMGSVSGVMPFPFGSAYAASKAALLSYGDSLRVELKPVGVDVVTVVASAVKSRLASRVWPVPRGSLWEVSYQRFVETIGPRSGAATSTDDFARQISDVITSRRKPQAHLWAGKYAWIIWFVHKFAWSTIWDYAMSRDLGLRNLSI